MGKIEKTIDYDFSKDLAKAGIAIKLNDCFDNCLKAILNDQNKNVTLGFVGVRSPVKNLAYMHGWLEDDNFIYEITKPQTDNTEYFAAFTLTHDELSAFLPIESLDSLFLVEEFSHTMLTVMSELLQYGYIETTFDGNNYFEIEQFIELNR